MKKNLLVTGGSGFVGTNLLEEFSKLKKYRIFATYFKARNFFKVAKVNYIKIQVLHNQELNIMHHLKMVQF